MGQIESPSTASTPSWRPAFVLPSTGASALEVALEAEARSRPMPAPESLCEPSRMHRGTRARGLLPLGRVPPFEDRTKKRSRGRPVSPVKELGEREYGPRDRVRIPREGVCVRKLRVQLPSTFLPANALAPSPTAAAGRCRRRVGRSIIVVATLEPEASCVYPEPSPYPEATSSFAGSREPRSGARRTGR